MEPFDPTKPNIARVWDYWLYIHSIEEILSFFDGLELLPPGLMPVRCWYGDDPVSGAEPRTATFLGGVARKP